jgi:hypothetical protein
VPVRFSSETQCNDCIDNDGDGLTDLEDPPCFAPWGFSESNFTGEVGDDVDPCRLDCAFDADFGSGNDECEFDLKCDALGPLAPECPFDPTKTCPAPKAACLEFCVPLAPNGCDCFGCCELPARSGQFVYVDGWACTIDGGDPMGCSPCTPHTGCINPCDECEICFGDLALPDGCVVQACPVGRSPCGQPCQLACGPDEYCLTGCCSADPSL